MFFGELFLVMCSCCRVLDILFIIIKSLTEDEIIFRNG